jgi:hypothetical protein
LKPGSSGAAVDGTGTAQPSGNLVRLCLNMLNWKMTCNQRKIWLDSEKKTLHQYFYIIAIVFIQNLLPSRFSEIYFIQNINFDW